MTGVISYNAANRLTTWDGNAIAYDLNGSMTTGLGQTYTWNERHQLTASSGAATGAYTYDGMGRRQAKTINGTTTQFLYDGQQPIQELTSSSTLRASLLTGGVDEIFSRTEASATQSYLTDALGSTVRLTDATGTKTVDYTYEAYGKASDDNAVATNTFQYTGRENDGTGLQFNRARYYDPRLGRFISEDPIGLAGGINTFTYVRGNPMSLVDPYGLADYIGIGAITTHLERLSVAQGDNFWKAPWTAPERAMLERLRQGKDSTWDIGFYHHEMAEANMCRPYLFSPDDVFLDKQRMAHEEVERNQQNTLWERYHPEVVFKYPDLFPPRK